jgi:hypothetical protein
MITLFRRRRDARKPKDTQAQRMSIGSASIRNLVVNTYGRAVIHLNPLEEGTKYNYWLTMSRDDALTLWAALNDFLDRTQESPPDAASAALTNDS